MVLPLLLGGSALLGGLSFLSDSAGDKAVEVTGDVVETAFEMMGVGVVRAVQGAVSAIKKESKGHGVEISATLTVFMISFFFFKTYISPNNI